MNKYRFVFWIALYLIASFPSSGHATLSLQTKDQHNITSALGTKSIWLSPDKTKLYGINLEAGSVYEYDRKQKVVLRVLQFSMTPGQGYNYKTKQFINSYQEKPVEACFTHNGRYIWISLHNAKGIVVWDLINGSTFVDGRDHKIATVTDKKTGKKQSVELLWIKTGTTPKIVTSTHDGRRLFVANWHSNNVSVIDIASDNPNGWKKTADIKTGGIPRGLAVSSDDQLLYVADMSSSLIKVVSLQSNKVTKIIKTKVNPRHIILDGCYMYVSINIGGELIKVDLNSDKIVLSEKTNSLPRTLALSPDKKILFVVCYHGNTILAYDSSTFKLLGSWKGIGNPVGIDLYQQGSTIEAWIAQYSSGIVKIITVEEVPT